ncbi:ABC transporter ATP-binding protein [Variovorax boronicumulans]|uniref:ABC transporter ATP-binding protein n=1 Tax=Variovorax boronicumulans TaxID=436515 RepID=UPI001C55C61A
MLDVTQITKRYEGVDAPYVLKGTSFTVASGEFFTLLGPSGCGKTTLLRSLAGLETPDTGEIRLHDQLLFSSVDAVRVPANKRNIAMVFQSYAIWPHMTVGENLMFVLDAQGEPRARGRKRMEEALEMVGLASFRDRSASQLSGGQQQRVALARAVVKGSKLLLLDEPLSNLDVELRVQMRAEIRDLQRRLGVTAIYVTHDQEEAMSLSDRVAVMLDGNIVELDTPENLYFRPRHAFTARFVGQSGLINATLKRRLGNQVEIETAFGPVTAGSAPDHQTEGPIALLVRPEHIDISAPRELDGENTFAGVIRKVTFLGRMFEYQVALRSETLHVQTVSGVRFSTGDAVTLRLPPAHCVVVTL